jgi:hypothetical protein
MHPLRRLPFVLEYVRQVEVYPREMVGIEGVFIDRAHYKLDFHIHQAQKQERIFDLVS